MKLLVIMALYNKEKYVQRAIESVLNQTYTNWHLVITDDHSTDGSLEVARAYQDHPQVTIIVNEKNRGPSYARSLALRAFRNQPWDIFTCHDADDYSRHDRVEIMLEYFKDPDLYVLIPMYSRFDAFSGEHIITMIAQGFVFYRRQVFDALGYFDNNTLFSADYEYYHRAVAWCESEKLKCHQELTEGLYTALNVGNNLTTLVPRNSQPRLDYNSKARMKIDARRKLRIFYRDFNHKPLNEFLFLRLGIVMLYLRKLKHRFIRKLKTFIRKLKYKLSWNSTDT